MAEKRPLCLYDGRIEELRAADSLPGGGTASAVTEVDQAMPVYILREPYGTDAWTIVRGDGLRATQTGNPSYTTGAAAWAARATLTYV